MESIKTVLMERDGLTAEEADAAIDEAREDLMALLEEGNTTDALNICQDHFGLEPDYLEELI